MTVVQTSVQNGCVVNYKLSVGPELLKALVLPLWDVLQGNRRRMRTCRGWWNMFLLVYLLYVLHIQRCVDQSSVHGLLCLLSFLVQVHSLKEEICFTSQQKNARGEKAMKKYGAKMWYAPFPSCVQEWTSGMSSFPVCSNSSFYCPVSKHHH